MTFSQFKKEVINHFNNIFPVVVKKKYLKKSIKFTKETQTYYPYKPYYFYYYTATFIFALKQYKLSYDTALNLYEIIRIENNKSKFVNLGKTIKECFQLNKVYYIKGDRDE